MRNLARSTASGFGPKTTFETQVSSYDRISGGLIALLALSLFLFTVLFLIWWFQLPSIQQSKPRPVTPGRELLPVQDHEETDVIEFDGSPSQAFTEAIEMTGVSIAQISKSKRSSLIGMGEEGVRQKDERRRSKPFAGEVAPGWNVVQEALNLEEYQRKLDFFKIEIGAVHKSNDKIWRIAQLSTEKVVTESLRSAESQHRYFVNQRTRLRQWDRQIIAQAGLDLQDVIAVHFYPDELVTQMQRLIDAKYQDRVDDLATVTFRIVGTPKHYRFEIEDAKFKD